MNANEMYVGYVDRHKTYYRDTKRVRDIEYINADKNAEIKIMVMPNMVIGRNIVNVLVEHYMRHEVCVCSGIKAVNGWHKAPHYAWRWEKKPYHSEVMTIEKFNLIYGNIVLETI